MRFSGKLWRSLVSGWRDRSPAVMPRRSRRAGLSWDCLEGRAVLSHFGGFHHGFGGFGGGLPLRGGSSGSTRNSQLTQDLQTLRNDIRTIQSQSAVTVAELVALRSDFQAIAQTGFRINRQALQQFENDLVTAVAAGTTDTSALQMEFNNLFTGSSVSPTLINRTFNDALKIAQDSHITTADLNTIAADQAKIQADLAANGGSSLGGRSCGGGIASASPVHLLIPGF
ncbi:MAG: hypothetical protein IRY99_25235 [Isosphaeraceae bacterium]|nr:hypothetical protein [Isosphaeraceae bacterium]